MMVGTVYKSTVATLASSHINTVSVTHITHFIGVSEQRNATLRDCGTLSPHFTLKLWITYYQLSQRQEMAGHMTQYHTWQN
jgi:hypothetical protein